MKYDFLNAIVLYGDYYVLTNEIPDGVACSEPWDVCGDCDLRGFCKEDIELLCRLHEAEYDERYKRVGDVEYKNDRLCLIKRRD